MICKKCGKEFKPSKGLVNYCSMTCRNTHSHSTETKQKIREGILNSDKFWFNVHKQKESSKIDKICPVCGNVFKVFPSRKDMIYCTRKCYLDDQQCTYRKTSGGPRKGSGYGKSGWYKGIWCDSSYELVWVIYNLEHNISFKRNKKEFSYIWDGETHNYIPDFILNDDQIIEIKGFVNEQTQAKLDSVTDLVVLYRNDLDKEFNYVEQKYGNNFIELYEDNPYKMRNNICKECGEPAINVYCSQKCSMIGNRKLRKI